MFDNVNSYYVFKEKEFVENYKHFESAFKNIYKNFHISYSFKTNYAPYICKLVKELGGYAEVVSSMEYSLAKKIGYDDNHIIFNGPSKQIYPNCLINVDSINEIELTNNNKIGLRVNIDVGQGYISRFGIDELELKSAFDLASNRIVGIHCHISQARSLKAWETRTKKMIEIADSYFDKEKIEYIDLGSGMYGKMPEQLYSQFSDVPSYEQYAQVTARLMKDHYGENGPTLFVEPGTTLISNYVDFICCVENIKCIKGQTFIVVGASKHNLGEICELKNIPFSIRHKNKDCVEVKNAKIVGYTCLEHDVIVKDYSGEIGIGDELTFKNVGGYSNVMKPPFIRPNVPMYSENGTLIKKAETDEDIFKTYE